jgi:hypothetical protein
VLDTRASSCVSESSGRSLTVLDVGGVPASGVDSVALNVTVTGPTTGGWVTVWPEGQGMPLASSLNYVAGQTVANAVTAKVGAGGNIRIAASGGCPHVIVDVVGWFAGGSPIGPGGFAGVSPERRLDTRSSTCISDPSGRLLVFTGGDVPADAGAVALNVTVTSPTSGGWVTVWPDGEAMPLASSVNYGPGDTVPNAVSAKLGAGGGIRIAASGGCPHVVVDLVGWFEPPASGPI